MRRLAVCLLLLTLILLSTSPAQTVLKRVTLGNIVEGMTFIDKGPDAKHIVVIDGMNLMGIPAEGRGNTPYKPLFNFSSLGFTIAPRGVAWIESEKLYIFSDSATATTEAPYTVFRLSDHNGRLQGTITFQWPADFVPAAPYVEEIAWIPLDAPGYAGDFIFVAQPTAGPFDPVLFVMNRNGDFVAQITLDETGPYYISPIGLAYRAPGRLLLGTIDGILQEIDLAGNYTRPPVFFQDATDIEGVAVLATGRVAITSHSNGKIIYLDSNLNRLPEEHSYKVGFGLATPLAVAWDPFTNEYIVRLTDSEPTIQLPQLAAISAKLNSARLYLDLTQEPRANFGRMDYSSLNAAVMPFRGGPLRRLLYFTPAGVSDGPQIGDGSADYRLSAFSYVPNGFVTHRVVSSPTLLEFFGQNAKLTGMQFELSPWMQPGAVIIDVAHYPQPQSPFASQYLVLVSGSPRQLLKLDASGALLATYDTTPLNAAGMIALKFITSGPYAGAFATVDANTDELIVFKLP